MLKPLERFLKRLVGLLLRFLLPRNTDPVPPPDTVRSILVIRQHNQLGDMLCAVPLLRALRANYGSATITLVASPVNAEVMEGNRYLDSVIVYDKQNFADRGKIHPIRFASFVGSLREKNFDIALVPMTVSVSFTSCLLAFLSGVRVRIGAERIDGRENSAAAFFSRPVELDWRSDLHRHQTLRNLDTARELRLPEVDLSPEITLSEAELSMGKEIVAKETGEKKRAIAFHPGAGKVPNRWPADRFAFVAQHLSTRANARIFVTKGPMDEEPVRSMLNGLGQPAVIVENKPIREVAAILSNMALVISNDTGIMHVAAAMGVPVLSLFGPTDPRQWAPVGPQHRYLFAGSDIGAISAQDVLNNALELLGRQGLV